MTQDQPQTPEPNQSPPNEVTPDSLAESFVEDTSLKDASSLDVPAEDISVEIVSPAGDPIQPIDSLGEPVEPTVEEPIVVSEESVTEGSPAASTMPTPAADNVAPSPPPKEKASASTARSTASTSSNKASAFVRLIGQLWGIVLPLLVIVGRWAWQVTLVTLKWIREAWKVALPRIRSLLPEGWRGLPDWVLTTVSVTLLAFVLWLTVQLTSPQKAPATAIDRPPAVDAPAAQPSEPVPDLTQIAKIQEQVAEVTNQYAEGLIQTVQANFQGNLLTVTLGDAWFDLDANSQAQLANELLKRSHKLDFDSLELIDPAGELLARSPVVGSKMVIYQGLRA